jgi:hypothetical protein
MIDTRTGGTERQPMRGLSWSLMSLGVVLGLTLVGCDGPNRGAGTQPSSPSGFFIDVTASPNTVRGAEPGGASEFGGCATVQVKVFDTFGRLVDNADVTVTTTLGIFRRGTESFVGLSGPTINGLALFAWCSQSERGTSTITATVEDAHDTTFITIF